MKIDLLFIADGLEMRVQLFNLDGLLGRSYLAKSNGMSLEKERNERRLVSSSILVHSRFHSLNHSAYLS